MGTIASSFRLSRSCFSSPGDDEKLFTTVRGPILGMKFVRIKHKASRLVQGSLGSQLWAQ